MRVLWRVKLSNENTVKHTVHKLNDWLIRATQCWHEPSYGGDITHPDLSER